jgi:hypothetical protein
MGVSDIWTPETRSAPDSFIFNITNGGRTAAKIRGLVVICHGLPSDERLPDIPDYRKASQHTFRSEPGYETLVIPGQQLSSRIRVPIDGVISDQLVREGDLRLYAYGLLTYLDAFGRQRELQFGFMYSPGEHGPLGWELPPQWALIDLREYNRHS